MKLAEPDRTLAFIPSDKSFMVACPPGCVRCKVYFDSNAVADWLRSRRVIPTVELFTARLVCSVCGEKPQRCASSPS